MFDGSKMATGTRELNPRDVSKKIIKSIKKKIDNNTRVYNFYKNKINTDATFKKYLNMTEKTRFKYYELCYLYDCDILVDAYLLEIKCPYRYKKLTGNLIEFNQSYYCQVQTQLYVTDLDLCHFFNCNITVTDTPTPSMKNKIYYLKNKTYSHKMPKNKNDIDKTLYWIDAQLSEVVYNESWYKTQLIKIEKIINILDTKEYDVYEQDTYTKSDFESDTDD